MSTDNATITQAIRDAYRTLATPGQWLGLATLRNHLGEQYNRHDIDHALKFLGREHSVSIVPESNQKTLTEADRWSAVLIGNQQKHLIAIH